MGDCPDTFVMVDGFCQCPSGTINDYVNTGQCLQPLPGEQTDCLAKGLGWFWDVGSSGCVFDKNVAGADGNTYSSCNGFFNDAGSCVEVGTPEYDCRDKYPEGSTYNPADQSCVPKPPVTDPKKTACEDKGGQYWMGACVPANPATQKTTTTTPTAGGLGMGVAAVGLGLLAVRYLGK